MKKVFIICFFFLIGLFCLNMYVRAKRYKNFIVDLSEDLEHKRDTIMMYKSFIDDINIFEKYSVVNCEIENINTGMRPYLYDLLNTNVIIYKMTHYGCASCAAEQIELIKYLQRFKNVIILSQNSNVRHLRLFLKNNRIYTDIFKIDDTLKLFEKDDNTSSFLLNVNKNGEILSSIEVHPESESISLLKDFMKLHSLDTLYTKTNSVPHL